MCTAISFTNGDHYFGRTLDLEYSYDEKIVITPRNFPLRFLNGQIRKTHYAVIGTATVAYGTPLYYEATNEKGLSVAGLNFPLSAVYSENAPDKQNIAAFEFILYILSGCESVRSAVELIKNANITKNDFSSDFKAATLHWMVSDKSGSVTVESVKEGLKIYDNPVGVLTNEPGFEYHMINLSNYMELTADAPQNRFCKDIELHVFSKGMGGVGLPGDLSSTSRFVRAAFSKLNSVCGKNESENVAQFFHILGDVSQTKGCVRLDGLKYVTTVYACCCNTDRGIYYYTTYNNQAISAVDINRVNLDSEKLFVYPMVKESAINFQN